MLGLLINLLVVLLVLVVVFAIVRLAVAQLGAPPVILNIVGLILLLVFLLYLVNAFGLGGPHWLGRCP